MRAAAILLLLMLALAPARPDSGAIAEPIPFDGDRAKAIVDTIGSDAFLGRKSGDAGGRRIEEYVAARFAAWGLEPAGETGGFFQPFGLLLTDERDAAMELTGGPLGPIPFLRGDDFHLITNSGSGDVTASVVAIGHGLVDARREWDDYGDADVAGKIVLIFRGAPENGYDWGRAASRDSTLHEAVRRGAAAVLFHRGERAVYGAAVHEGSYFPRVPIASVGTRVVNHLLGEVGYDRKRYLEELKEGPLPLETGRTLRFRAAVTPREGGKARNVIGRLPGSDPALAREIVIVGAHMDHIGVNSGGVVFNGADDNGSGTSIVLELARSLASMGERPRRTVVFVTFAGEEQGLLGSRHFVDHPTFDLDPVVAMVNFDMVGQGNGKIGIGGGEYYPDVFASFRAVLDSTVAESLVVGRAWGGESSDHAPFRNAGIPVCNVWSEGEHRFYHTMWDDPEWIRAEVLGPVGRMAGRWLGALADWPEPLAGPRKAGRALLHASYQIDFDGVMGADRPPCVRGRIDWFDADRFAAGAFIEALGALRNRTDEGDSLSIVYSLGDVTTESRRGRRAVLIGLDERAGRPVPPERLHLLDDLDVSFARWPGGPPPPGEREYLDRLAGEGVTFLVRDGDAWRDLLPADGKAWVRLFPGRGEKVAAPDSLSRKRVLFLLSVEGRIEPARLARVADRLGRDRVHIDLVPWLAHGGEGTIPAFLEELQEAGGYHPRVMRALLGGNLGRL